MEDYLELSQELLKLDKEGVLFFKEQLSFALWMTSLLERGVEPSVMAQKMGIELHEINSYKTGGVMFDLRKWAGLKACENIISNKESTPDPKKSNKGSLSRKSLHYKSVRQRLKSRKRGRRY